MKRTIFVIRLLLVAAMLIFIWGHSMMPADLSDLESRAFLRLVRPLVEALQRFWEARGRSFTLEYLVRKLAHFTEFFVLGVLSVLLFLRADGRCRLLPPAGMCLAVALVDEGIQMFSEGRGPAMRDVTLDCSGAAAGILLTALALTAAGGLLRRCRRRP